MNNIITNQKKDLIITSHSYELKAGSIAAYAQGFAFRCPRRAFKLKIIVRAMTQNPMLVFVFLAAEHLLKLKEGMKHIGLFEGEGGFSLAARWMGWETKAWCEWDEFNQVVLKYHFPNAECFGDITKSDFTKYANTINIVTGGFPCQPFSNSGEQLGETDNRWLFDEMLRAIREIQPEWVVAENVFAIASPKFAKTFEHICSSMEAEGYEVQPIIIPATAVEAEHERYRVWFIAHSSSIRFSGQGASLERLQPTKIGNRETSRFVNFVQRNSLPFVCESHYGLSRKLAERAIHAAGNAIVPQLAFEIFQSIVECQNQKPN